MTHMWALYAREVKRFQKLWMDTVFSPVISVVLYLAVFGIVVGSKAVGGVNYVAFVYAGLLAMTMFNSSFSNPAFALIISKNVGNIIDLQVAPIKAWKIGVAYALAALTRGIATLIIALLLTGWFVPGLTVQHPFMLLIALAVTGIEYGMLGVTFGMWAKNFEALTFVTTFIMQPMIFLAGVFYPIATLPAPWSTVSLFNPLHHNVNLIRYALTGYHDADPLVSLAVMLGLGVVLFGAMNYITTKKLTAS